MWPKAFAQLVELAPHISRLLPMADRFFQSKTATDESSRNAMDAMADGLRGDLGQVTAAHAGLYKQLDALDKQVGHLGAQVTTLAADTRGARTAAESVEIRLTRIEGQQRQARILLILVLLLLAAVLVLLLLPLIRGR